MSSADGETVVECFRPSNALSADADAISRGLYTLSEIVTRAFKPEAMRGFFGGEFGYAIDYDNSVFWLRPDYQDIIECDCGRDARAEEWHADHDHGAECYQTEYAEIKPDKPTWRRQRAWARSLCRKYGIPWNNGYGSAVHCTCAYETECAAWYKEHPHEATCPTWLYNLPNFRHHASGFEVRWYKWIGRDTEISRDITGAEWAAILDACVASLPADAVQRATEEHDRENTPEFLAQQREEFENTAKLAQAMVAAMRKDGP